MRFADTRRFSGIFIVLLFFFYFSPQSYSADILGCRLKCPRGFVHAHDGKFYLDGSEYRQIGFNKFDLLLQYMGHEGKNGREKSKKALHEIGSHGFRLVRVIGSPFFPSQFYNIFFDENSSKQKEKREKFFAIVDEMLDECDRNNLKVVYSIVWNIENFADLGYQDLYEGISDPHSLAYARIKEFTAELVERYKDRKTIAMWEVPGNEYDLSANLKMHPIYKDGIFLPRNPDGCKNIGEKYRYCFDDPLAPGLVVRDYRNNFTFDELAELTGRMAGFTRSIDSNHAIVGGYALARKCAVNMYRAVTGDPRAIDRCEEDDFDDSVEYIDKLHRGLDALSVHHYDKIETLSKFQKIAVVLDKPLIIGEFGPNHTVEPYDKTYTSKRSKKEVRRALEVFAKEEISILLFWAYGDDREFNQDNMEFHLRYGVTDDILAEIQKAQQNLQLEIKKRH